MKRTKLYFRLGVTAIIAVLSTVTLAPAAMAQSSLDISDPMAVVTRIAPGLVADYPQKSLAAISSQQKAASGAADDLVVSENSSAVTFTPRNPSQGQNVSISPIQTTSGKAKKSSKSGQFHMVDDGRRAVYVQSHDAGARFLSAIEDRSSHPRQEYRITLADGSSPIAEFQEDGGIKFTDSSGQTIGAITAPWAFDSNGKKLSTAFKYSAGRLTQTVDATAANIQYPILADPNWTYSLIYTVGYASIASIWSELTRCFSCSFPVEGAPQNFPNQGDSLPLVVRVLGVAPLNFSVKMISKWYLPTRNEGGWLFMALPGHIDGNGSTIGFNFFPSSAYANQYVLTVNAYIKNDFWAGNTIYRGFAEGNWNQFRNNLVRNMGLPQQG